LLPSDGNWETWLSGVGPRRPLGRWLDQLLTLYDKKPEIVGKIPEQFWQNLSATEKQLNTWGSNLEEIILFDLLTYWLVKKARYEATSKGYKERFKTGRKRWRQVSSILRMALNTYNQMVKARQIYWRSDELISFHKALHQALENVNALKPPLSPKAHFLQKIMVDEGGPRLWTNPLVWNEVIPVAVAVLDLRDVKRTDSYSIISGALALLFSAVAGMPFDRTTVTKCNRTHPLPPI
jgi:hypothetical protein